jgi:hypothetical protein
MTTETQKKNSINSDNWTFCHYKIADLRSQVMLSAEPTESEEPKYLYTVTVLKEETIEVSTEDFDTLEGACDFINNKYKRWEFVDQLNKKADEGGCGSCIAH